jgi:hypothetical protein
LEWWEQDQTSILKKFKDIVCKLDVLPIEEKIRSLQLIDVRANTYEIIQFIKKIVQSKTPCPYGEENYNADVNKGGEENYHGAASEGEEP